MREIYERVEDNNLCSIEVDTDLDNFKDEYQTLFSIFIKLDNQDDLIDAYEEFLELKESLIIAVEYEDKAKYVGSRIIDGWNELYFYTTTSKELNSLVASLLESSKYIYESNIVKDKKWDFYDKQLFPTELDFAHIQSDKIIFLLEEEGDDLSIARDVEHYVIFDTPTQKERFLETLKNTAFKFKDDLSTEDFEHGIAIIKSHSVNKDNVYKVIDELFEMFQNVHGYYEGWSTTLINEES